MSGNIYSINSKSSCCLAPHASSRQLKMNCPLYPSPNQPLSACLLSDCPELEEHAALPVGWGLGMEEAFASLCRVSQLSDGTRGGTTDVWTPSWKKDISHQELHHCSLFKSLTVYLPPFPRWLLPSRWILTTGADDSSWTCATPQHSARLSMNHHTDSRTPARFPFWNRPTKGADGAFQFLLTRAQVIPGKTQMTSRLHCVKPGSAR